MLFHSAAYAIRLLFSMAQRARCAIDMAFAAFRRAIITAVLPRHATLMLSPLFRCPCRYAAVDAAADAISVTHAAAMLITIAAAYFR